MTPGGTPGSGPAERVHRGRKPRGRETGSRTLIPSPTASQELPQPRHIGIFGGVSGLGEREQSSRSSLGGPWRDGGTAMDTQKIIHYRKRSVQLLESALAQMRGGHWSRSEDLLWGSLTLAVKGVALSRGLQLDGDQAVREYAEQLGRERKDRRIRDAFSQLGSFGDAVERLREGRFSGDRLVPVLEDVGGAIQRLWELAEREEDGQ